MADKAIIRIGAHPDSSLNRALKGTVDAVRKASKQIETSTKKRAASGKRATREEVDHAKRMFQEKANSAESLARKEIRDAERAARAKERAIERTRRAAERAEAVQRRESERTARKQIQDAERAASRRKEAFRRAGVGLAGAAAGAAYGAVQLAGRAQRVAGVDDTEGQLDIARQLEELLTIKGGEAGLSDADIESTRDKIIQASTESQTPVLELMEGLASAQTRFDAFREFAELMPELARGAKASGVTLDQMIGTLGTAKKAFRLETVDEMREAMDALIASSQRGTISVGNLSDSLASNMGTFALATGRGGTGGFREFLGTAQVLGTSQAGADQVGTFMERLMATLKNDTDAQKELRKRGVKVTEGGEIGGELLPVREIAANMAGQFDALHKAGVMQDIFKDVRGVKAADFMMKAVRDSPDAFGKVEDATGGKAFVDEIMAKLTGSKFGQLRQVAFNAQASTIKDADRIVQAMTPAARGLTELQTKFPLLTASMTALRPAVIGLTGALLGNRLLGGGGVPGAGGLAGAGGGVVGKLGGALSVASAGVAGYQVANALGAEKAGEWLGAKIFEWVHDAPNLSEMAERTAARGGKPPALGAEKSAKPVQATVDPAAAEAFGRAAGKNSRVSMVVETRGAGTVTEVQADDGIAVAVDSGLEGIN